MFKRSRRDNPGAFSSFCSFFLQWVLTEANSISTPPDLTGINLEAVRESVARLFQVLTTDKTGVFATILVSSFSREDLDDISRDTDSLYVVIRGADQVYTGLFVSTPPAEGELFRSSAHQTVKWFRDGPAAFVLNDVPPDQRRFMARVMEYNATRHPVDSPMHAFYTQAACCLFSRLVELA